MIPTRSTKNKRLSKGFYPGHTFTVEDQRRRIEIRRLIAETCEMVKKMSPRKRLTFLMYYDHGYSQKEIAKLCGVDEGTVSRRLAKVRSELTRSVKVNNRVGL